MAPVTHPDAMTLTARLQAFLADERKNNDLLEHLGVGQAAQVREQVLRALEDVLASHDEGTVTAEEAANITGCNVETVRRAVRNGEIQDLRTSEGAAIHVRMADLEYLKGKARKVARRPAGPQSSAVDRLARLG